MKGKFIWIMRYLFLALGIFFLNVTVALADGPITVITNTLQASPGFIFTTPVDLSGSSNESDLLIVDNAGQQVFRQHGSLRFFDFKRQGDVLTYFNVATQRFEVFNQKYQVVDTWEAVGYPTDIHELQLLDNGHALLLVYREFEYDMSQIVPGGSPTATVVSCVIQEIDENKNLAWEWDGWNYNPITHTIASLTSDRVDYDHCNAIERDHDGNILLSSRNLNQVTKINRQTDAVIWKLGGMANEFTFTNDAGFALQHDIRRLPNGHITLFDDGTPARGYSRGVEFEINEASKIITRTWEFQGPFTNCCGNAQRLPNGNTLINWGMAHPTITEVTPAGDIVWAADVSFAYRSFRFDWFRPIFFPLVRR